MGANLSKRQIGALGVLSTQALLFSGITFGWSSLQTLLQKEGFYACATPSSAPTNSEKGDDSLRENCHSQTLRFAFAYTLAQFCHVFVGLPVGYLLDDERVGVIGTGTIGLTLIAAGSVVIAAANPVTGSGLILPGVVLIGVGGPAVFFPLLRRAEAFPGLEAQVTTLMNALFDASAAVFSIMGILTKFTDRESLFACLGAAAVAMTCANAAVGAFCLGPPSLSSSSRGGSDRDENQQARREGAPESAGRVLSPTIRPSAQQAASPQAALPAPRSAADGLGVDPDAAAAPLRPMVFSRSFGGLVLFGSVHVLRSNCYLGTVGDALAFLGDQNGKANLVLGLMLPLGVLLTPLVGSLIDWIGPWPSLMVTNASGVLQGIASVFLPLSWQPATFALYGSVIFPAEPMKRNVE